MAGSEQPEYRPAAVVDMRAVKQACRGCSLRQLCLSARFKLRGFAARELHLSMSRNEIADYLGLAVETVSRLFSRFQQQELLLVQKKNVRILDSDRLCQLAGGGADEGAPSIRA